MKRKAIDDLIIWKDNNNAQRNKPLFVTGTKGVGKTFLVYDFANAFFARHLYINIEKDLRMRELLNSGDYDRINNELSMCTPTQIAKDDIDECVNNDDIVFIFDEISYLQDIASTFDILQELQNKSELSPYIILISSKPVSCDVINRTHAISLYPLTFDEFLMATANEWYIELIRTHYENSKPLPQIVHNELLFLYRLYLQIGGMPSAINEYLSMNSTINIMEHHEIIMGSYKYDITKGNSDSVTLKIIQVIDSMPLQLMKENKKFQYRLIRKGTTYTQYKDAIDYLNVNNLVIQSNKIPNDQLSNSSSIKDFTPSDSNFKLYMPDTGLLFTMINKMNSEAFTNIMFNDPNTYRTLIENNVAQTLNANNYRLWFWESTSSAKINFIIEKDCGLVPVEIFDDTNTRSKSVSVLRQLCNIDYGIKISSKNFSFVRQVKYIPFYAMFCL